VKAKLRNPSAATEHRGAIDTERLPVRLAVYGAMLKDEE
jgi:hypothetical protein